MKKSIIAFLATAIVFFGMAVLAEEPVKIIVGGNRIRTDVDPVMINDRMLLPVRAVFEAIGAEVSWDNETETATAQKEETTVKIKIGENKMYINGAEKELDVPATMINDRTMVPVRACAEAFNLEVEWLDAENTAKIKVGEWLIEEQKIIEQNGYSFKNVYDERGNLAKRENSDLSYTEFEYNEYGDVIKETFSDGSWTKHEYNEKGLETKQTESDGYEVSYEYDERGNVVKFSNSLGYWEEYEYDENNNWLGYSNSDKDWTKYTYDERGNCIKSVNSYGGTSEYMFNEQNRLIMIKSDEYMEKYDYDKNGNEIYKEDSFGSKTTSEYNEKNQVVKTTEVDGFGGSAKETVYAYDKNGNLLSQTADNGSFVKYTYDENNRLIRIVKSGGNVTNYVYDEAGNVTVFQEGDRREETSYIYIER